MIDKMKKDTPRTQSNKIFSDERIDPLLSQVQSKDAESLLGETGLAGQLKKRLAERMLEAALIAKDHRRLPGFEDHVIRMDARGMSVREIRGHLLELYGLEVSPDLISTLTDEVLAEVEQWQTRPLEAMSPIVS